MPLPQPRAMVVQVLAVFAACLALYVVCLSPGLSWGDSAKLAVMSVKFQPSIDGGHHPVRNMIGFLFNRIPVRDVAYRQNLLSAFFGAATCAVVFLLLRRLNCGVFAALIGTASLALSHVFWHVSCITESYTLFCFFIVVQVLLVVWWEDARSVPAIFLWGVVTGLGLGSSVLAYAFVPVFVAWIVMSGLRLRGNGIHPASWPQTVLAGICGGLLGFLPMLVAFAQELPKESIGRILQRTFATEYSQHTFLFQPVLTTLKEVMKYLLYLGYQFPGPAFLLGFVGIWFGFRRRRALTVVLFVIFAVIVLVASPYMIQRKFYIYSGSFLIFAIWAGLGAEAFSGWLRRRLRSARVGLCVAAVVVAVAFPPVLYYNMPGLVRRLKLPAPRIREIPYRDNLRFFLRPDKIGEDSAERYAEEVFRTVEPNSVILTDFTVGVVLEYYQGVLHRRPDVRLRPVEVLDVPAFVRKNYGKFPIYLADDEEAYQVEALRREFGIVADGCVWRVQARGVGR